MNKTSKLDNSLRSAALSELSISELVNGRDKLSTGDVSGRELTVMLIDFATYEKNDKPIEYPIVVFAEAPDAFYCGGVVLGKMCKAVMAAAKDAGLYDGVGVFEYPQSCEPLRIKLVSDRTGDGERNITRVIIL